MSLGAMSLLCVVAALASYGLEVAKWLGYLRRRAVRTKTGSSTGFTLYRDIDKLGIEHFSHPRIQNTISIEISSLTVVMKLSTATLGAALLGLL
jgi:hypothetical protein